MANDRSEPELDRELPDLPQELRWLEWMRRIEAVLFASAAPVAREDLARVVGQGATVDLLVDDLAADLEGRAFEIVQAAGSGQKLGVKRPSLGVKRTNDHRERLLW